MINFQFLDEFLKNLKYNILNKYLKILKSFNKNNDNL